MGSQTELWYEYLLLECRVLMGPMSTTLAIHRIFGKKVYNSTTIHMIIPIHNASDQVNNGQSLTKNSQ